MRVRPPSVPMVCEYTLRSFFHMYVCVCVAYKVLHSLSYEYNFKNSSSFRPQVPDSKHSYSLQHDCTKKKKKKMVLKSEPNKEGPGIIEILDSTENNTIVSSSIYINTCRMFLWENHTCYYQWFGF